MASPQARGPFSALLIALPCLALGLAACGGDDEHGTEVRMAPPVERSQDPRVARLRAALEDGRLDLARTLHAQVAGTLGVEGTLLAARLELLAGDAVAALREIEAARRAGPEDPRVYATACEVYAVLGRLEAAEEELRRGWQTAGKGPDLDRAQGVLLISTSGGAEAGLALLERAVEADPELPFVSRALQQARLLVGRRRLSEDRPDEAARLAAAALELDPSDPDLRQLLADAHAALRQFDEALSLYAALERDGYPQGETPATVHHMAATYELTRNDRARAIEHYRACRELGWTDEQLGFGATVLREAAASAIDRGIEAYGKADLAVAEEEFRAALDLDPDDPVARNHLGVVLFQRKDYLGAARAWTEVLGAVRRGDLVAPEPVHLNLARAWRLAGLPTRATAVLEEHLKRHPEGPWSADTREMLARLASEGDG
jgi:tetratricopeptide (TPR) repeat protein